MHLLSIGRVLYLRTLTEAGTEDAILSSVDNHFNRLTFKTNFREPRRTIISQSNHLVISTDETSSLFLSTGTSKGSYVSQEGVVVVEGWENPGLFFVQTES